MKKPEAENLVTLSPPHLRNTCKISYKETVTPDFVGSFLAWMDKLRLETEHLNGFCNFSVATSIFGSHF